LFLLRNKIEQLLLELVLYLTSVNRLMAVPNIGFTEPVLKFMEELHY